MLKKTISTQHAADILFADEYASWHKNYAACLALAEYLENLSEDAGNDIELDKVTLRCGFSLYESIEEFNDKCGEQCLKIEDVRKLTTVITIQGSDAFIAQEF